MDCVIPLEFRTFPFLSVFNLNIISKVGNALEIDVISTSTNTFSVIILKLETF